MAVIRQCLFWQPKMTPLHVAYLLRPSLTGSIMVSNTMSTVLWNRIFNYNYPRVIIFLWIIPACIIALCSYVKLNGCDVTFVFCNFPDSVYSERYMRSPKPEDNYVNYQQSSVSMRAEHIRGKKFLLIHGTADGKLNLRINF